MLRSSLMRMIARWNSMHCKWSTTYGQPSSPPWTIGLTNPKPIQVYIGFEGNWFIWCCPWVATLHDMHWINMHISIWQSWFVLNPTILNDLLHIDELYHSICLLPIKDYLMSKCGRKHFKDQLSPLLCRGQWFIVLFTYRLFICYFLFVTYGWSILVALSNIYWDTSSSGTDRSREFCVKVSTETTMNQGDNSSHLSFQFTSYKHNLSIWLFTVKENIGT